MGTQTITDSWQIQISKAVKVMKAGGVILFPTETIWGIGADATNDLAIEKIFELKERPNDKKMISLLAEAKSIFNYATSPPIDVLDIIQSVDRPTSFIFDDVIGISPLLIDNGRAGFRLTSSLFCKALIKQLGAPLVATSANLSGNPFPENFDSIPIEIQSKVDYFVDPKSVNFEMTQTPSQIVYVANNGFQKLIRS